MRSLFAIGEFLELSDSVSARNLKGRGISTFAALAALTRDDVKHLTLIEVLNRWIRLRGGKRYRLKSRLTSEQLSSLNNKLTDLEAKLNTVGGQQGLVTQNAVIHHVGEVRFIGLQRQSGDRFVREVGGARRSKPLALALIRVTLGGDDIEIRSAAVFENSIIGWLRELLGEMEEIDQGNHAEFDPEAFRDRMLKPLIPGDGRLRITRLKFRRSTLYSAPPIEVSAPSKGSDIRIALKELTDEAKVIELKEPSDIESLDVMFEGLELPVSLAWDSSAFTLRAAANEVRLTDTQRRRMSKVFLDSTGFPLNKPILRGSEPLNLAQAFDSLFDEGIHLSQLPNVAKKYVKDLVDRKFLEQQTYYRWSCRDAHDSGVTEARTEICPVCGDSSIDNVEDVRLSPNIPRIRKLALDTLSFVPGFSYDKNKQDAHRKIDSVDRTFTVADYNGQVVFIHFAAQNLTRGMIRFFERSQKPLLIIRIGTRSLASHISESGLFYEIPAGRLVEDSMGAEERISPVLAAALKSQAQVTEERKLVAGRRSLTDLSVALGPPARTEYQSQFEDDVFNLFTWWMHSAERWGKEVSGKPLPEGVGGWSAGRPRESYSIAWDAKWNHTGSGYNLSIGEKRKAAEYVKKLRASFEIQAFSHADDLNVFAFVGNNFKQGQMEEMAKSLRTGIPEWTGQVAFIDAEAVLELYDRWRQDSQSINLRIERLRIELGSALLSKDGPFVTISKADISQMVDIVLRSTPERTISSAALKDDLKLS